MNAEVRDALPDYVNHRLGDLDAAIIREHIASCADCQAEVAVLEAIRSSGPLAPKIDLDRIAMAIPAYPAITHAQPRTSSRRIWALAAAAAIVAVGGWAVSMRSVGEPSSTQSVAVVSPSAPQAAPSANAEKTVAVATPSKAVESSAVKSSQVEPGSLSLVGSTDDLSDADLESLVSALDGIDAVPSAEPGSVTTTVEDIDGF
jgi:anti-sigma factor RsiW